VVLLFSLRKTIIFINTKATKMKYYSFILQLSLACCEQRISNKSENSITDKEIAISVAEKNGKRFTENLQ